jgi:hypothetical protein
VALPPQKPGQRGNPGANGSADPVSERIQTDQLADQCRELEEDLERLKARYEMFFLGVEKREPNRDRDEIKRRVERIKGAFTRNTGLKFRIQTLAARFLSYERMWLRSAREKEEGTYRRDLLRARRHAQDKRQAGRINESSVPAARGAEPEPRPAGEEPAVREPAAAAPAVEPPVRPLPARPAPAAAPGPVGEQQLRSLYDAYIAAKKSCNEDVSRLTYDAVARSVQRQVPELLQRFKARSVEFKVVIQGGKAVLKAVPKS